MEQVLIAGLSSTIAVGTVIIIAGLGELLEEWTGVINLGLEGIIALGAMMAQLVVINWFPNAWLGLLAGSMVGLLCGLVFAVASVTIKSQQYITGVGMGLLCLGLANQIGRPIAGQLSPVRINSIAIPFLSDIPLLGKSVFNQSIITYIAYFILPLLIWFLLFHTSHGISMRAAGQNPAAAEACGAHVNRIRFVYSCLAGLMFGLAGAYLTLYQTGSWQEGIVAGKGWVALTLVFFSGWNPLFLIVGAVIFGAVTSLGFILQLQGVNVNSYLLGSLPYLSTLGLICFAHLLRRYRNANQGGEGPSALGTPFYRE